MNQNITNEIKIAFFSNHESDAMAVLRVLGPAKMLGIEVVFGYQRGGIQKDKIGSCNVFVHQRDFCKDFNAYETMISYADEKNIPVLYDLDDLLFELPTYHPDWQSGHFSEALLPMLQAVMDADVVTVSTKGIAEYLSPYNKNINIIPNYVNDEIWKVNTNFSKQEKLDAPITIGYMGGHTHKPDLQLIVPVLLKLIERFPAQLKFKFWGINPPKELKDFSESFWNPPETYLYTDFADFFQNQSADFVIAPLQNNLFNSCKSPIKYLEYGVINTPGVYSKMPPYEDVIHDGVNGFLADSEDDWLLALSELIRNEKLRTKIAKNAADDISENWLLSKNLTPFYGTYINSISDKHNCNKQKPDPYNLIRSVNAQIRNEFTQKDLTIKKQVSASNELRNSIEALSKNLEEVTLQSQNQSVLSKNEIQFLKDEINNMEEEIVNMSLSKSWRITRPLRAFYRRYKNRSS